MKTGYRMHLTHDEPVTLWVRARQVRARVRVWHGPGCDPLVLVESRDEREVGPFAHRIATYAHHCLLKGKYPFYVEHDTADQWSLVRFTFTRGAYAGAERANLKKSTVETLIGDSIE